jgi:Ser/Thr protein kinase RdoA (MazF antagonist)
MTDSRTLAASLEPTLRQACEDRLGDLFWFKADWQRGGAATAKSSWTQEDGAEATVVVKLPVVQREWLWLKRLQEPGHESPVVPRLYAGGDELGGYDLAWVVIEFLPHGPLGLKWHDDHVLRIAEAIARFHALAAKYPVDRPARIENWGQLIDDAQESIRVNRINDERRWIDALKQFRTILPDIETQWNNRPVNEWQHGDLHVANAMTRQSLETGPVCLIDLAEVHPGHWLEDAVYLERQMWARPDRMGPVKPIRAIAQARKKLQMSVDEEYPRLAMIRRALLAATAPKFMKTEGHPRHLAACLDWLELAISDLG